ncbi:MAG: tetratricopeptide repeat protein [Myxococcota bacterium]
MQARELLQDKQYDAAESVLRDAVEREPGNLGLQLEYGQLLVGRRRYNQAVWPLLRAATDESLAIEAGLPLARSLMQTSNHEGAIRVLTPLLERDPEDVRIREMRAHALVANHEEAEALVDIDWLLDHPTHDEQLEILELKLRALLQLQRAEEAQALLTDLRDRADTLASLDRAPRLCSVDAKFSVERGDAKIARSKFEACIEDFPGDPLVAMNAAAFFDSLGETERATETLEAALEERPESLVVRKALADRLRALGRAEEARDLLRAARDDNRIAVAALLADHHMELDDPESARRDFEWAIGAESEDALFGSIPEEHRFMLGDILVLLHQNDRVRRLIPYIEEQAYAQFLEARMLYEEGRYRDALAEFERGFRIWPSSAGPRFLAGRAAEQLGDFAQAVDHYRAALRGEAEDSDAGLALARIYSAQGSWVAAAEAIHYHIKGHPRDADALRLGAALEVRLGNRRVAAQLRSQQSALPGQRDVAIADHARDLAALESPDEALRFLVENVSDPGSSHARQSLAAWCEILVGLGRGGEALAMLERAQVPDGAGASADPELEALRGQVLLALERDVEARNVLEPLVAAHPEQKQALLSLARMHARERRIDEAVALLDRVAELDRDEASALVEAGRLLANRADGRTGSRAEAERRLREAMRREPTSGAAPLILAQLDARAGEHTDETLGLAERAVRFAPGAESFRTLGMIQLARGETEVGIAALRHAIELGSGDGEVHFRLGLALLARGDRDAAREALERSLAVEPFAEAEAARAELARLSGAGEPSVF